MEQRTDKKEEKKRRVAKKKSRKKKLKRGKKKDFFKIQKQSYTNTYADISRVSKKWGKYWLSPPQAASKGNAQHNNPFHY